MSVLDRPFPRSLAVLRELQVHLHLHLYLHLHPQVLKLCIDAMSLPGQIRPEPSNGLNLASHRDIFGFCKNIERMRHAAPKLNTDTHK